MHFMGNVFAFLTINRVRIYNYLDNYKHKIN